MDRFQDITLLPINDMAPRWSLFLNKIITNITSKLSLGLLSRLHRHSLLRRCDEVISRDLGIMDAIPDDGNRAEHTENTESPRGAEPIV